MQLWKWFLCGLALILASVGEAALQNVEVGSIIVPGTSSTPVVDFSYAFSTPHRMTVARPESSDKTLIDVEPGSVKLSWTYENLINYPLAAFVTPPAVWGVRLTPQLDGRPFAQSTWTRADGFLPILDNTYTDPEGSMRLEITGGASGALVQITVKNTGTVPHTFGLQCDSQRGFFGYNPGYVDPDKDRDCLLAGWGDRADRVIVFGVGAQEYGIRGAVSLNPAWTLQPGEQQTAWIVRPYRAYSAALPTLRAQDWQQEVDAAKAEWRGLLDRCVRMSIPDQGVLNGLYACIGDMFIMREPVANGYIAGTPGTDGYRAPNSGEAAIVAIALDQLGLHKESAYGFQMCLDLQGEDGDWNDPQGWGHLMWAMSGFKSWTVSEHYKLTGDRAYLEAVYPRMLASSRWQEAQRARTRKLDNGERPLTYGLMPRGMGDCGLKDGDDLYGVFFPHNCWAVYADRVAMETAETLGKAEEAQELRGIYETARADLLAAVERGAIAESDYRWIPGVLGKTTGSRWGALNALFPCGILPSDHELITGTLRYLRAHMSPGGLPLNTGWMPNGLWVAIALDNLAETHLVRDEGDEAASLLYATLNHATPLYTWCEERGPEPGAKETTGDRQHLWTPLAVVREIRDSLVMESGSALHLGRGVPRHWFATGQPVGVQNAPTHFGNISYELRYDSASKRVQCSIAVPETVPTGQLSMESLVLHVRLPQGLRLVSLDPSSDGELLPDGSGIEWKSPKGAMVFEATAG